MKKLYSFALVALCCTAASAKSPIVLPEVIQETSTVQKVQRVASNDRNRRAVAANPQAAPDLDIIFDAPEGKSVTYVKNGTAYGFNGQYVFTQSTQGSVSEIVTTDDGKIYMNNVISLYGYQGWLEGTVKDGVATFQMPQLVEITLAGTTVYEDYAVLCEMTTTAQGQKTFTPCKDQVWKLKINDNGSITPVNPDVLLGDCAYNSTKDEFEWTGGGDIYTSLTPLDEKVAEAPASVTFEDWYKVSANGVDKVQVGVNGYDIYIKGIFSGCPDGVISGKLNPTTGIVTFPKLQYIGIDKEMKYTSYFSGAQQFNIAGNAQYIAQDFNMTYNPSQKILTSEEVYVVTTVKTQVLALEAGEGLIVKYQSPDVAVTSLPTPEILQFFPADDDYYAELDFYADFINADGVILDASKLFYNIILDDEPFTFYDDEYPDITGEMVNVPINFSTGYSFFAQGDLRAVVIYAEGFDSLGLQYVYINGDKEVRSEIAYADVNALRDAISSATVESETFFDLQGREVKNPAAGLYIRRAIYSDGTIINTKVFKSLFNN